MLIGTELTLEFNTNRYKAISYQVVRCGVLRRYTMVRCSAGKRKEAAEQGEERKRREEKRREGGGNLLVAINIMRIM
jgi:hypothetical protein